MIVYRICMITLHLSLFKLPRCLIQCSWLRSSLLRGSSIALVLSEDSLEGCTPAGSGQGLIDSDKCEDSGCGPGLTVLKSSSISLRSTFLFPPSGKRIRCRLLRRYSGP